LKGEGDEVGFRRVVLKEVIQQAPPRGRTSTVEDMINCRERCESKTKETSCAVLKGWVNRLRNGKKGLICHSYAVKSITPCSVDKFDSTYLANVTGANAIWPNAQPIPYFIDC
jgi:hypothetical protein